MEDSAQILTALMKLQEDAQKVQVGLSDLGHKTERLSEQHEDLSKRFGRVELGINGDGNGVPGLRIRVDRNEREIREVRGTVKNVLKGLVGGVTTLLAAIAAWFGSGGTK